MLVHSTSVARALILALLSAALLPCGAGAAPQPEARIEAVVLQSGYAYGRDGTVVFKYRPAVLYADGSYTFDTASALSAAPRKDGTWQRIGQDWYLNGNAGKPVKVPAKMLAAPAQSGRRLQGDYRAMPGTSAANTGAALRAASRSMQFMPDGTVRLNPIASIDAAPPHAQGTSLAEGGRSGVARYALDGYSITLTHPDGHSERRLFYFFPDDDKAIGVGGSLLAVKN